MTGSNGRLRVLFFVVFTVSGFSALIYEAIWSHYLKLFLGHAAYAQTLVLAIFMGGMAAGSWVMAKRSERIVHLLLGYAIVEGTIGLLGLVFHPIFTGVTGWMFDALLPNVESPVLAQIAKWLLGALLILPQSVLLGMTFPLLSAAIVRRDPKRSGETLAMLYFTNCLGAALGVLVSGFVLVQAVGLPGTIMTAALFNVALALFVWLAARQAGELPAESSATARVAANGEATRLVRWMLTGAAVTGAAAFLYEIAWIRMLSLVLGSTTHAFELMLSAFILGIALGGLWVRKRIDGHAAPVRFLGAILLIMAVIALLSLPVYNATFDLMSAVVRMFAPTDAGYAGFNLASHLIAMLVMIPTTFFCGMTLPVMTHVLIRHGAGERAIGQVYAWNTAGAIAGIVIAVHVLMPLVGVKGIVIGGALLHAVLGVAYLSRARGGEGPLRIAPLPAATAAAAVLVAAFAFQLDPARLASGVFRHGHVVQDSRVLFYRHGKTASVSLVDDAGLVSIATNGKPDASVKMGGGEATPDEITMVLAGALPVTMHPAPKRVANIGIGSGLTSHVVLASDAVEVLDTIEIEPLMARAAEIGFMPRVERTFRDPRSRLHFEDAKTFFAVHRSTYDVIVSEPSNPWVSGVATLFSSEFYQQVLRYLEPDGLFVQWVQIYESDLPILTSVLKALAPNFDDFAIYNADDANLLIIAKPRGSLGRPDARLFSSPAMRAELAHVGIVSVSDVEGRFLGSKRLLLPLLRASGIPANSDYYPFVDINAPRARVLNRTAIEYPGIATLALPFFDLLGETGAVGRDHTVVSPFPTNARDRMVAQAVAVRDAVESGQYAGLDGELARAVVVLDSPREGCAKPAVKRAWLDAAFFVASRTGPALSAEESKALWARITGKPCAAALNAPVALFVELLGAIARRDRAATAQTGTALFENGGAFTQPAALLVTLTATAASQIALDRPEEALKLLRAHAGATTHTPSFALALHWLQAIAVDRLSRQ